MRKMRRTRKTRTKRGGWNLNPFSTAPTQSPDQVTVAPDQVAAPVGSWLSKINPFKKNEPVPETTYQPESATVSNVLAPTGGRRKSRRKSRRRR